MKNSDEKDPNVPLLVCGCYISPEKYVSIQILARGKGVCPKCNSSLKRRCNTNK
jgi:hypothetical protein